MAINAIVILALLLQGVYSRPQDSETSDTTSSGVTINVEGSGTNGVSDIIRNAVAIPVDMADVGVSGAQVGVDTVRQFLNTLFGSSSHVGSGSVQMSMTQPAWGSMMNMMRQGLSASGDAASQGTQSANQMMSGIMSFMSQPAMMTVMRNMIDSGVLTQGEGTTVNVNVDKLPSESANQLTSMFGSSNNGTVTIDLAQPASWGMISTFLQRGMSLANDGIALGMDSAKMPIEFASQGIDMMRQIIPGQSANSVSFSAAHPASSLGSFGNSIGQLATNSAQMKLDAMQLPIDVANNGIATAREFMTGSGTQGGSGSITVTSSGVRNGMSGSTGGVGGLINAGARLAESGVGLGLDTANMGVNMAGTGIDATRNFMTGLLGARPYFGSVSGAVRTPSISFSTRTRGY